MLLGVQRTKPIFVSNKLIFNLRIVKRTEGISTTDIVGRLLMMSKEHHHNNDVIFILK